MLQVAISAGIGRTALAAWARGLRVDTVLVREKQLPAGELVSTCREVRAAVRPGTRVLVAGGRVDVALAAGLDGVHLGSDRGRLRTGEVWRLWSEALVSVSCHSQADVARARDEKASMVLFGPVFGKRVEGVEVVPGAGLAVLAEACLVAGEMPVMALGGVTDSNAVSCVIAGAAGVAGIGMYRFSKEEEKPGRAGASNAR